MLYPWQSQDWTRLNDLRAQMPHALLLQAVPGIGEIELARTFAQALLCESPRDDYLPCGTCGACQWLASGNHPDFRGVCPEVLADTLPGAEARAEADGDKKTKTPSKEIKIEQVREVIDFASIGSHRQGLRVVLLYPAEALNVHAANALLKTLEEPPEGVIFLLVTTQPDRLLPTILSRCRRLVLTRPDGAQASRWLMAETGLDAAKAAAVLAEAGGAPLAARALAEPEERGWRDWLLGQLAQGAAIDAFACAEQLHKGSLPGILETLQRWCFDVLAERMTGTVRFFPGHAQALRRCGDTTDDVHLLGFLRELAQQRQVQNHPLNTRVLLEALFLQYKQLFGGPASL
ncbi:DNA polymerase III subunit delta' [Pandoraea horticolens]|uniref:DNA polymerase III subunit delta n=1 Tax=Pandoraea horticolens TaxID=2508298 RepID=A0A5E4X2X9_9BURK|nr:DNA polymerase III subunit delta' [Pandoraea horticolens]VVE30657.1 DNA polymerase III subunit delta' [Pandoraea horticolens]